MTKIGENKGQANQVLTESRITHNVEKDFATKKYVPSKNECITRYEISISFLSRGCVIRVGCATIPFESIEDAMIELNNYVEDPYTVQEKWSKFLNK